MALIAIRTFMGEVPRLPAHLLPDGAAQRALNCNFAHGQLFPLRNGGLVKDVAGGWTPGANSIGSLYTKDGSNWWVTDTANVTFHQSPVIDEQYNRIYFVWPGDNRVHVGVWGTAPNGTTPDTSMYAGVPAPTVAPVLSLVAASGIPGLTTPTWTFRYWYESAGMRYQDTLLTGGQVTEVTAHQQWTFDPLPLDPGTPEAPETPEAAVLAVEAKLTDGTREIFRLNSTTGASVGARTSALPGGVELTVSMSDVGIVTIKATWGPVDTRAYCYTVKNLWGEESAPSPASLISPTYLQVVHAQLTIPTFTGYRAQASGTAGIGLYRTFGGNSEYLSVAASFVSGTTYSDPTHTPSNVGNVLKSSGWAEAVTNLNAAVGMHAAPNGWFLVAKGNTVYMSEPYRPHAWPYSMTFPKSVRGICVGAQAIIVTTSEATYAILGPHPAAVSQQRLTAPVGGITSHGMCNVEGGVAVVTNDGIMFVNGTRASLEEGQRLFTRDDWRARYSSVLANMRLVYFDGKLLGCLPTADTDGYYGFVLRTDESSAAGNFSRTSLAINTVALFPSGDALYYTTPQDGLGPPAGRNVFSYGTNTTQTAEWWSKDYIFQKPERMGVFYIRCAAPLTVEVFKDGVSVTSISVTATGYYRLPAVGPGLRWSVKLTGVTNTVQEFVMGHTVEELKVG